MQKIRNQSVDAIKGAAIVLVMLGHVFVHNFMEDPYLYDMIKAVQMPLFMIISGYLCGSGLQIQNWRHYVKQMKKRMVNYLVPLFSWLTLLHWWELKTAYRRIFFQLDYGLWFLAVLFFLTFYVYTARLAASWVQKNKWKEPVFWMVYDCFCGILMVQYLTGNSLFSPYLILLYIPFYMLGYITAYYGKHKLCWGTKEKGKLDCKSSKAVRITAILMFLGMVWLAITEDLNQITGWKDTLIQMIASVCGSLGIIYGILQWKDGTGKRFFAWLGNYTLEIYVIHYHFAYLLNLEHRNYEFYTISGVLFVGSSFAVMCAVTAVVIWSLKKTRFLHFLAFGKKNQRLS